MRHVALFALGALALLVPSVHARGDDELRDRVRAGVQRTDKDLGNLVNRDKLNEQQRTKFDAAIKDLHDLDEAVKGKEWEGKRKLLEHAVENIDFVVKQAPIADGDRQLLNIDLYTLGVILDNWKTEP